MSNTNKVTVDVEAKFSVERETAEKCLKMVEWFMNDHNDVQIISEKDDDGYVHYIILDLLAGGIEKS